MQSKAQQLTYPYKILGASTSRDKRTSTWYVPVKSWYPQTQYPTESRFQPIVNICLLKTRRSLRKIRVSIRTGILPMRWWDVRRQQGLIKTGTMGTGKSDRPRGSTYLRQIAPQAASAVYLFRKKSLEIYMWALVNSVVRNNPPTYDIWFDSAASDSAITLITVRDPGNNGNWMAEA